VICRLAPVSFRDPTDINHDQVYFRQSIPRTDIKLEIHNDSLSKTDKCVQYAQVNVNTIKGLNSMT